MRVVTVRGAEPTSPEVLASVERTFAACTNLGDLLGWAAQQAPRVHIAEIVTQDEYTHDVVMPFGAHYLSFDTT